MRLHACENEQVRAQRAEAQLRAENVEQRARLADERAADERRGPCNPGMHACERCSLRASIFIFTGPGWRPPPSIGSIPSMGQPAIVVVAAAAAIRRPHASAIAPTAISPPAIIFARNHLRPQSSLPAIISASNHL